MDWVNVVIQGVLLGGLYALYGTGLSLMFGVMRIVNLAHGDLIVLAAFLAFVFVDVTDLSPFLSLLVVVPLMFVAGVLLQAGVLNFTLGKGVLPPVLVTFGLSVVIQNVLLLVFSADDRGLDAGSLETASVRIGDDITLGWLPLITLLAAVAVLVALQTLFSFTRLGRAMRATSDDLDTAALMGINPRRVYAVATGLALAVVGVAGVMLGLRTNVTPSIGPARLIFAFEAVIIGGLGNLWGTLAGGLILGVAQGIGARLSPGWDELGGHLVFLAVLAFRPTGLFARTREGGA